MQIILRENNEEHAQNVQDDRFREAMRFKSIQMSTILFMKLQNGVISTKHKLKIDYWYPYKQFP